MNLKNVYNGSEEIGFSLNHIRLPKAGIFMMKTVLTKIISVKSVLSIKIHQI